MNIFFEFFDNKKNVQDIVVVQMYEIMKIQMHFQSNYLMFWFKIFIDVQIFWTKYQKDNNGQSWVVLYGTKDDVK